MRNGATSWTRARNVERRASKNLGTFSNIAILGVLVLIVGLIYLAQGTKATSYDYQLSSLDSKIEELEDKKEDLVAQRARLTSIATAKTNEVAVAMENAEVAGYAE